MKIDLKIKANSLEKNKFKKFEVDYLSCSLEVNDLVTPETVIGRHYGTGQEIRASSYGQIATIYFNPMHCSLMIMIIFTNGEIFNNYYELNCYSQ